MHPSNFCHLKVFFKSVERFVSSHVETIVNDLNSDARYISP